MMKLNEFKTRGDLEECFGEKHIAIEEAFNTAENIIGRYKDKYGDRRHPRIIQGYWGAFWGLQKIKVGRP